ncbi:hypothetical protein NDU88_001070 [Pleurodeles waltl]|uniref:Uncharacterized protein n=1 Tax=Pleurodeles waltl TaxID=8319 RepID=A0AAV7SZ72_PLEWA|nr:hypothetical protein NDU88_001070 [Pleurodeles waltl]
MPSTEGKGDRRIGKTLRTRYEAVYNGPYTRASKNCITQPARRGEAAGDAGEEKRTRSIRTRPQRCLEHARALNCLNSSRTSRKKQK